MSPRQIIHVNPAYMDPIYVDFSITWPCLVFGGPLHTWTVSVGPKKLWPCLAFGEISSKGHTWTPAYVDPTYADLLYYVALSCIWWTPTYVDPVYVDPKKTSAWPCLAFCETSLKGHMCTPAYVDPCGPSHPRPRHFCLLCTGFFCQPV